LAVSIHQLSLNTIVNIIRESPTACIVVGKQDQIILCNYKAQHLIQTPPTSLRMFISEAFSESQWSAFSEFRQNTSWPFLLSRVEADETRTFSLSLQQESEFTAIWLQEVSTSAEQKRFSLSALLSHELRAPLVSIRGYTELVVTERIGALNDRQKRGLGIALRNIGNLVELIDNLLLYSRLSGGAGIGKLTRQHLQQSLQEMLQEATQQCLEKKISFQFIAPEKPVYCRLDVLTFGTALRNILSNAVKFTDVDGKISLEIKSDKEHALLLLRDSGVGISKEALHKIFEPFHQPEGVITRQSRGMGLGLAVSREIILQHGGSLTVSSSPHQGSCFTISLPLTDPPT
jgi:signal transduction histidine kinase